MAKKVILTINPQGDYYLEKSKVLVKVTFKLKLAAIFKIKKKTTYIRADRTVAYGRVVDAMSAAKLAGVHKMSMLTVPTKKW